VGAGSSFSLADSAVDLGCSDLIVSGTLNAGSAAVAQAKDVNIASGGTLEGGSGSLDVTGNWDRTGAFNAGTGSVRFVDGCGTTNSTISDNNTFNDLELTTAAGKQVTFQAGQTTTVNGTFALGGASENLLAIRSTVDDSETFLDLAQAASGDFVDVKDSHATGQPVTLGENSVDSGSHNEGWIFPGVLVPGLSLLGLIALAAAFQLTGRRALRDSHTAR
jgi:hypothetical protein